MINLRPARPQASSILQAYSRAGRRHWPADVSCRELGNAGPAGGPRLTTSRLHLQRPARLGKRETVWRLEAREAPQRTSHCGGAP